MRELGEVKGGVSLKATRPERGPAVTLPPRSPSYLARLRRGGPAHFDQ